MLGSRLIELWLAERLRGLRINMIIGLWGSFGLDMVGGGGLRGRRLRFKDGSSYIRINGQDTGLFTPRVLHGWKNNLLYF